MKSKNGIKLSTVLVCFAMLLAGFAVGINVGSQLFTQRPDFVTTIILVLVILCCIMIPVAKRKEKENSN